MISDNRDTVFPVPEGISRTQLPPPSSVFLRAHIYSYCSGYIRGYGNRTGRSLTNVSNKPDSRHQNNRLNVELHLDVKSMVFSDAIQVWLGGFVRFHILEIHAFISEKPEDQKLESISRMRSQDSQFLSPESSFIYYNRGYVMSSSSIDLHSYRFATRDFLGEKTRRDANISAWGAAL